MSRLNQLVSDCRVKLAVWSAEDTDISLTQLLCYREREIEIVLALFPKSTIKPQLPQPQVTVTLGAF